MPHWQVTWSNSPKGTEGIGTIMYLMAMELAGNEGFSPDDYEQSTDALVTLENPSTNAHTHPLGNPNCAHFLQHNDNIKNSW